jgi:hypothetical protein
VEREIALFEVYARIHGARRFALEMRRCYFEQLEFGYLKLPDHIPEKRAEEFAHCSQTLGTSLRTPEPSGLPLLGTRVAGVTEGYDAECWGKYHCPHVKTATIDSSNRHPSCETQTRREETACIHG